ncbi:hypothetical protein M9Y10_002764 [Tritrichomonas musculus]|uniref:Small GTP-binding protein n=1 Tax=Tritrichomonas musculus TaxID=1915356 RepID=A0ABR2LC46_9EUKA
MHRKEYVESFKVCICGRYNVGKTALINRYLTDLFTDDYKPTIATCFTEISVPLKGKMVSIKLWDTAGEEKYQSLTPLFMQDSDCVILVIDITDPESFKYVENWTKNEWISMNPLPLLLICLNKCDLNPSFDLENVANLALKLEVPIVQTSALLGTNVKNLFKKVVSLLSISTPHHAYACTHLTEEEIQKPCC